MKVEVIVFTSVETETTPGTKPKPAEKPAEEAKTIDKADPPKSEKKPG